MGGRESARASAPLDTPDGAALRPALAGVRELATLATILDTFGAPAWVLDASSRVLHESPAARRTKLDFGAAQGSNDDRLRVVPITLDGESCRVVIARDRVESAPQSTLPPSLALVADLVVRGMSNREIARATGKSLATIRVYVARIYRHLGVRGRVDLARVTLRDRGDAPMPTGENVRPTSDDE